MATRKKTVASGKKKSSAKKVMEHDPFAMPEEEQKNEAVKSPQAKPTKAKAKSTGEKKAKVVSTAKEESQPIDFGGSLIISEVEICRNTLLDALQGGKDLILDGGDIQQIDGAGLQLLASFVLEAKKMNVTFEWCDASQVLCESSDRLDLTELLQLNDICKAA